MVGHGSQQKIIATEVNRINRQMEQNVITLVGTIYDPSGFFPLFDLVLGLGRSALESMSCGIPTVIVGPRGFAGIVCEEQIDNLAYYNFSGRNVKNKTDEKHIVKSIIQILKGSEKNRDLGTFSRRYVLENYDIKKGAKNPFFWPLFWATGIRFLSLSRKFKNAIIKNDTCWWVYKGPIPKVFKEGIYLLSSDQHAKLLDAVDRG